MHFDHEKMDVYVAALDFCALANESVEAMPQGHGYLVDQLRRASSSIVLNIAEGAGKRAPLDKRRFYLIALGSTTECAAILDVFHRLKRLSGEQRDAGRVLLSRVLAMLTNLCRMLEKRVET